MKHGFVKVAAAIPSVRVADTKFNLAEIKNQIIHAEEQGVEVVVFPELSITSYSCQDLFGQQQLLDNAEHAISKLLEIIQKLDVIVIVGAPISINAMLLNCAVVMQQGRILGVVAKTYLPNYGEFYEKRWFASSRNIRQQNICYAGQEITLTPDAQIFQTDEGMRFGIEICEDVWAPTPPSNNLALAGAEIIFNLSASNELIGKHAYLKSLLAQQSARTISGYVYSGCGFGESTQDVVYGGNAMLFENGVMLEEANRFSLEPQLTISEIDVEKLRTQRRIDSTYSSAIKLATEARLIQCAAPNNRNRKFRLTRKINPHPFIPTDGNMELSCNEILNIQVCALAKRLVHTQARTAVIGISGGLDSTLALLVCVKAFDKLKRKRKNIIGITMPGLGTTDRTYHNAVTLMKQLGISVKEISIAPAVKQHFEDINHNPHTHDTTYENSQARERTQILMDVANQYGGLVIGTGDLSELALGWCTYNGDHMSMYAVNVGVPKTLIRHLVRHIAATESPLATTSILLDIIDTPISPELIPAAKDGQIAQKTEDIVGPYELHDFFLYHFLRHGYRPEKIFYLATIAFADIYSEDIIKRWLTVFLRRFFSQQFKRSCLPDGPKVGSVSLSPRGDWRMPSDAVVSDWLKFR